MENIDNINVVGIVNIEVTKADGTLKYSETIKNTITNTGRDVMSGLLGGIGGKHPFTDLQLGTGTTPASALQTALIIPVTATSLARKAATLSLITTNVTNDTLQLDAQWTSSEVGSFSITEVGAFNSDNVMLGRQTFGVKTIDPTDIIRIKYNFIHV